MKKLVCTCDMCGKEYKPRTEDMHISDWEITSTNRSSDVLMDGFDLCPTCQNNFKKRVKSILVGSKIQEPESRIDTYGRISNMDLVRG